MGENNTANLTSTIFLDKICQLNVEYICKLQDHLNKGFIIYKLCYPSGNNYYQTEDGNYEIEEDELVEYISRYIKANRRQKWPKT